MAQNQPSSGGQQPMSDVLFDLVTIMSNCGEAVEALDEYIDDAQQENNREVLTLFQQIREDELRHCEMARSCLGNLVRQGKF